MNEEGIPDGNDLRKLVHEIAAVTMPFGKYGPAHYPPKGCPLMDLPMEYLAWFSERGFPKGKLGYLMSQCWLLRNSGFDNLFDPWRQKRGGRTLQIHRRKPKSWDFGDQA